MPKNAALEERWNHISWTPSLVWWCKLQDRVAPSSAIAELKSACKGYAELLLLKHVRDFMEDTPTSLQSHAIDASAAKGIILRQGAGPVKYLSVRQLWIQEAVKDYGIQVYKIDRTEIPRISCALPVKKASWKNGWPNWPPVQ